ncbi:hypothetical protein [Alkalihalobacterium alkalinitrilicum]|uniref:hypothetical protein n=1 Tax=Alkalihalobacterium alkalinitrilicum TaxID=427920 RepID=UPI001C5746B9|nr:hypothetical protein [Alkalihalobacterium alkalinitrilicum]
MCKFIVVNNLIKLLFKQKNVQLFLPLIYEQQLTMPRCKQEIELQVKFDNGTKLEIER